MTNIASKNTAGTDWWRGAVIYQVYPRSFQDSDGDGMGDMKGIIARLPHIASLGVDAIWLSPFFKSPQADMGYDVSDYRDVDPMFGTLDDCNTLIDEAHKLGIKIIIDLVISHTSDQHDWFKESRTSRDNAKADWYIWADPMPDGTAPNNWLSIFGGPAWEWDGVRRQYYMHNFLASQPDLNFHNMEVQGALLDTARFWLDLGVDGFRLDTVVFYFHDKHLRDNPPRTPDHNATSYDAPDVNPYGMQEHLYDKTQPENIQFLQRMRAVLDEYEDRTSIGEVGDGGRSLKTVAQYTSDGDKLHMCYTFDLLGPDLTADHIRRCVQQFEETVKDGWVCWAFSNHDVERHVTRFMPENGDRDHIAKLSLAVLCALRGSLCLYQGEELGLPEAELKFEELQDPYGIRFWPSYKGRDGCRTPMPWETDKENAGFSSGTPWLPVVDEHRPLSADIQEKADGSVLAFYRDMLAWRKNKPVLLDGDIDFLETNEDLLVFERSLGDQTMLFVFNLTGEAANFVLPSDYSDAETINLPIGEGSVGDGSVKLSAYDVYCAMK